METKVIYNCELCFDNNGQMIGLLPSVTTVTVGVSSPLWKGDSCESPLGEDDWTLTYNEGTGQFLIEATSFNEQQFALAMHMHVDGITQVINNEAQTTLYQQILAKAAHMAITKLPDTTTAVGLIIRNQDVNKVSSEQLLGVMYQELNGNTSSATGTSTATLPIPSIGVGANGINPTPPGQDPFNFSWTTF